MSNVPKLRFKGFADNWYKVFVGDIYEFKNGLNKGKEYFGQGTPIVNFKDVFNNRGLNKSKIKGKVTLTDKEIENYNVKKGDLFFTRTSEIIDEIGYPSVMLEDMVDCVFSGFVLRARAKNPNNDLNHLFKKYVFFTPSFRKEMIRKSSMTTRALTSGTAIKKMEVKIPQSMEEQFKIGEFFSLLELKIMKQQEKIELLKKHKKAYIQKIFNRELRFKDKNGNEFTEWETKKLSDIAMKIMEKNKNKKITNVISNSAVRGLISQKDYFDKSIANNANISNYYVIAEGDFVYNPRISTAAPYGPVSMYELDDKGIVSPLYLCFRINDETVLSEFMKYYFQTHLWHKHIYVNGDQGARHDRVSIKDKEFFTLEVQIPTIEEQKKIIRFLECISEKICKETKYYQQLKQKKKALMQQMFI